MFFSSWRPEEVTYIGREIYKIDVIIRVKRKRRKKSAWKIFGRYLKEMNHSYIKNQGLNGSNCRSIYDMKF